MKRILNIAFFIVAITATVFSQEIQTKHYDFKDYDKIEVNNSIYVKLIANNKEGVSVSCDNRLMPAMQVKKMGNKLSISMDWDKVKKIIKQQKNSDIIIDGDSIIIIDENKFRGGLKATVNIKNITEVEAISAGMVKWKGNLPSKRLRLIASSAGSIKWDGILELDELDIECSSAGSMLGDLKLKNIDVKLNSAANFQGNVNASRSKFDLDSVSNAKIAGNIDTLYVEANTSSNFRAQELIYKYAEVSTNTYGRIYLSKSGKVVDNTPRKTGVIIE